MTTILIILVIVAFLGNVVMLAFFLMQKRGLSGMSAEGEENAAAEKEQLSGLKMVIDQMNNNMNTNMHELNRTVDRKVGDLTRTVDTKINESSKNTQESIRSQLSESAKLIREVTIGLTKLDETNKQVVSFADQLQNLQDILKNPKHRGILGEYYLETLLKNVLAPGQYQMQYPFKGDGGGVVEVIADAVVFVKEKIIPIDSKFSLENYNKLSEEKNPAEREKLERVFRNDLKERIKETAKYIRPAEKTMDFAFMFIPHEAIYYDLLVNKIGSGSGSANGMSNAAGETDNLIQWAASQYKVIIVSPTSFLAYLQTVLQALNAMVIEEKAKDIIKHVSQLGTHLKKYEEYHLKLGASLSTVVNHYTNSGKEFKKVDKDILRIVGEAPGVGDIPLIEKPETSEAY
jgi:DNA recombination protein RmuC